MRKFLGILLIVISVGCLESKSEKSEKEFVNQNEQNISTEEVKLKINNYKIDYNLEKVSHFAIEDSEMTETKALVRKLSEYSTKELENLPNIIRLTLYIVVPFDITKDNLENTLKSIVSDKTEKNNDLDEILIFAYDDKNDIGKTQYTFGKLLWSPFGKTGNVTPDIAQNNDRSNYKFEIIIKDKVGNINETDLPTKRELLIYNEMMDEKYIDMQEEEYHPSIMKKFNVKSKKELMAIWLKVASHKN